MVKFKTDDEYRFNISLPENRKLPKGNNFDFHNNTTDVEVLKEILDGYFDTSSLESTSQFPSYKMDFSINVIDAMIIITKEKLENTIKYFNNIESQLNDINHRIIKSGLYGNKMSKEEKLEIFDMQEELLMYRRKIKDTMSVEKVMVENFENIRNFILSMNQRKYKPKSNRFQNDDNFFIDKAANIYKDNKNTRLNTSKERQQSHG